MSAFADGPMNFYKTKKPSKQDAQRTLLCFLHLLYFYALVKIDPKRGGRYEAFCSFRKKEVVEILRRYSAMELEFRPEDSVVEVFAEGKDSRKILTVYEHDIGPRGAAIPA